MSLASFFKALSPFASAAAADVDAEIKAIQDKASADIASAKLRAGQRYTAQARAARLAAWQSVKADYENYLAGGASALPSSALAGITGPTGPSGAAG